MPRTGEHSGADCLRELARLISAGELADAWKDPVRRRDLISHVVGSLAFLLQQVSRHDSPGVAGSECPCTPDEIDACFELSAALGCQTPSAGPLSGAFFQALLAALIKYLPELLDLLLKQLPEPAPEPDEPMPEPNFDGDPPAEPATI